MQWLKKLFLYVFINVYKSSNMPRGENAGCVIIWLILFMDMGMFNMQENAHQNINDSDLWVGFKDFCFLVCIVLIFKNNNRIFCNISESNFFKINK